MNRRAVFLDKDGTLIEDVPYNVDPDRIKLGPGADEGLPRLHATGFLLIVISNQGGVARGLFPEQALGAVGERLRELLLELGVPLAGFHYCPHHPEGTIPRYAVACRCRKPQPGLILDAALGHGIALDRSWFVGDILDDVEAGRRAGCRAILIDNGNETQWLRSPLRRPDFVAADLHQAARLILSEDRQGDGDRQGRGLHTVNVSGSGPGGGPRGRRRDPAVRGGPLHDRDHREDPTVSSRGAGWTLHGDLPFGASAGVGSANPDSLGQWSEA